MSNTAELKFYTLKEVSEILHVTTRTLQTYIYDGKLKAAKIGGKWIISVDNLQDFVNGKQG